MSIKILSDVEITEGIKVMIRMIFQQSRCPNESLINSITGCKGIVNGCVVIGSKVEFVDEIEY